MGKKRKSKIETYRILLSRFATVICLFFFFTTQSLWEQENKILSDSLFCLGIVLVAIASLGRMWCSVYIAGYKNNTLVTQGPYSMCRNPLYFFSLIGIVGIGCATETFSFPIAFVILFALYYPFVIKSEENRLSQLFGIEFEEYRKKVSAFFPRLSTFYEPQQYTVNPVVYRRSIHRSLWFIWIVGILEIIEGMKEIGLLTPFWFLH